MKTAGAVGVLGPTSCQRRCRAFGDAKILVVKPPIRLLAIDIDGTLLNPEFQISPADMAALRRAQAEGVEVVVVTGRRHTRDRLREKPSIVTCSRLEPAADSATTCRNFAETRS